MEKLTLSKTLHHFLEFWTLADETANQGDPEQLSFLLQHKLRGTSNFMYMQVI